ncbi:hypothetical protein ACFL4T_04420 [candidate division KSB1 bacterium]
MKILTLFSIFVALLFFNCKKDWGSQATEIYTEVDAPHTAVQIDPQQISIDFSCSPESMVIGSGVWIDVEVSRNDGGAIDFEIFYRWKTGNPSYYNIMNTIVFFSIFNPLFNNSSSLLGFEIFRVYATMTDINALQMFGSGEKISEIIAGIGNLIIKLDLGYKDTNGSIKYFASEELLIPLYY